MGICTILLFLFFIFFIATKKKKDAYGREQWIIQKLHMESWIKKDRHKSQIKTLYPQENEENKLLEFWCKRIRNMVLISAIFLFFGACSEWSVLLQKPLVTKGYYLSRPGFGEGANTVSLEVSNEVIGTQTRKVAVLEEVYETKERIQLFQEAKAYLDLIYLGENQSSKKVTKALVLPKKIPKLPVTVSWRFDKEGVFFKDGTINKEALKNKEVTVCIYATVHYQKWSKEYPFSLQVLPEKKTKEEEFWEDWEKSLSKLNNKTKWSSYLSLPESINETPVFYKGETQKKSGVFVLLAIGGAFLAILQVEETLKKQQKNREEELFLEYPNLVNKCVLLLGAGMTIGGAFQRISLEYLKEKERKKGKIKYAYEEVLITQKEIANGISEVRAYEQFGKRIRRQEYLKFSTLISQNLRKGSDQILELLEFEALEAFEKRKAHAKKQGEEIGTKLLLPMMIMLLLVMGIIIIPAFLSF